MKDTRLVAEFLGWTKSSEGLSYYKDDSVAYDKHFQFDKNGDWNSLMPLVGKCYYIDFEADDVEMSNLVGDISCAVLNIDIYETYEACVELIKYLNSKK